MKIRTFLLYCFLFISCQAGNIPIRENNFLTGKVIRITDGDTFDILTDTQETIRIRMNGIDCPERGQDYYQVCKDALADYIFGKNVRLETYKKDRYKRTIADVFYQDQNINLLMVKNGFAWHFKKYSSDESMAKAEQNARAKKIGLWQMKNPVAPWDFRKLNSKNLQRRLK